MCSLCNFYGWRLFEMVWISFNIEIAIQTLTICMAILKITQILSKNTKQISNIMTGTRDISSKY